jgi:uncharacterized protein YecE (DUF72 family)
MPHSTPEPGKSSAVRPKSGKVRIGISGWRYKPWRGTFYPPGLAQRRELEFAAQHFNSIEINGTFYSLQRPKNFAEWFEATPPDFQFAIKGSRFITHMRRLLKVEQPLANFFAQGLLRLEHKLGPILWQFPPNFKFEAERLEAFFVQLPRTRSQAAELARKHDARLKNRAWLSVRKDGKLRHAIEIRHESFVCREFITLLRRHNISLVQADAVEWPLLMDITSEFLYCRLHGSEVLYTSGYTPRALDTWAARVTAWTRGQEVEDGRKASSVKSHKRSTRDVFVYFDNDAKVRAPYDAQELMRRIGHQTMHEKPIYDAGLARFSSGLA